MVPDSQLLSAGTDALATPLPYPVFCFPGALQQVGAIVAKVAPAHRYAIISDDQVSALYAEQLRSQLPGGTNDVFTIPPGEREKTRARWAELSDALIASGAGRDTTVIALGGGVIGDLAGFVAATFMRGVAVVQVPTTLLAMVDASVGGKTAIDTPLGKNLIGAFHNPRAVVIDPMVLRTLPMEMICSGLAEVIKHGVIASADYFNATLSALPTLFRRDQTVQQFAATLTPLIAGSVKIKAAVVSQDERESGLRHILNFGHTIGHAIERELSYEMAHGDAVAIGMVAEARLAEALGIAQPGLATAVQAAVQLAGLPHQIPAGLEPNAILGATKGDKKNRSGTVRYALPTEIGVMDPADGRWSVAIPDTSVLEILRFG